MLRYYNNSGGCIISKATAFTLKSKLLNTLRSLSAPVSDLFTMTLSSCSCVSHPCSDNTDAQSWYLLGRCYMSQQKYSKAYEAYQQAVYRDGRNPTFWCSIGVLYYQINQYRDALDAYSRAIRLNPYISEVWYDLGTLVSLLQSLCLRDSATNNASVRIMQQSNKRCTRRLSTSGRPRPLQYPYQSSSPITS